MKASKTLLYIALPIVIITSVALFITDNTYIYKAFYATYMQGETSAHIDDLKFFENRTISASNNPTNFELHTNSGDFVLSEAAKKELGEAEATALMVLKDGKKIHEQYWDGYSDESNTNSFSMTKTIVTLLLGAAIKDGYVKSLNQPITDFLPELAKNGFNNDVSIGDFSSMTSGMAWSEDYKLPINPTAKAYFGTELEKQMLSIPYDENRTKDFIYSSGDTQILAIALRRATKKDLSQYASEKLWQPLGIRKDAYWSLDKEGGIEKGFCCIHANASTWGKIAQLLLQKGNWNGKQIISANFINSMITPQTKNHYGFGIWLTLDREPAYFHLQGFRGQFVAVVPEQNIVIVKLARYNHEFDKRTLKTEGFFIKESFNIILDEIVDGVSKAIPEKKDIK